MAGGPAHGHPLCCLALETQATRLLSEESRSEPPSEPPDCTWSSGFPKCEWASNHQIVRESTVSALSLVRERNLWKFL